MSRRFWGFIAIPYVLFLGGCDDPVSPRLRTTDQQAQAVRNPGPPTLTTSASGPNQINLSWQDNSPNETGWEVHRSTTGASGDFTLLATLPANTTFYANTGLAQQTEYCYRVRSFRNAGPNTNYGSFFNTSCSTTPALPAAPSNVSVKPVESYGVVEVTWSDNSSTENGFYIQRSAGMAGPFETVSTLSANATLFQDYGRAFETQVCYRVLAFNNNGASDPSNVDCTAPPNYPTDLVAQSHDSHSIDLTWSDNSAVEDGYEVQRAETNSGVFVAVATTGANAKSYHDASITPDVRYTYRVRAMKDGGFTAYSNYVTAFSAGSPPAAPTIDAIPNGSTAITIYWNNPSDNTQGDSVERSLDGGSTWATAALVDSYSYAFTDGGLTSESQVCYRVFAVNGAGHSPASNTDCTTPPAAATNFSITYNSSDDSDDLRWTDNSHVEDSYSVLALYYDEYGNSYIYEFASLPPNTETYHLDNASAWFGYYFTVVAVKDGGYSDWAAEGLIGATQNTPRASTQKDPRIASRSGRLTKPFDVRLSSLKKLRR